MSEKNTILSIHDLKISYGAVKAVKGIDIEVQEGTVVALLGANGAGKTSTLQSISGLVEVESGEIIFEGQNITNKAPEKITPLGIAQSPEGRQIFADLTVLENLQTGAFTVKDRQKINDAYERVYAHFPILEERSKQIAGTLSGGELQMLAIGRAMMASPKLLLLDEPSLGLAPLIVRDIFKIINDIRAEGTTVLIVEQNALQTLKIADYGYAMELGKISLSGPASELLNDQRLIDAYLGSG
ncbi:MAG: ABC transporter ATP-binding protein [Lachnospiraceae bacterium]|nr:ABC transporter ATP-binding protein [Lachnospiraceae bacterium]